MTPNSLLAAPSKVKVKSFTALFSLVVLFSMVLAACGGGSTQSTQTPTKHILRVATQSYDYAQSGFNIYNGHPNAGLGLIYETLYFVNVNDGSFTPMLAKISPVIIGDLGSCELWMLVLPRTFPVS